MYYKDIMFHFPLYQIHWRKSNRKQKQNTHK